MRREKPKAVQLPEDLQAQVNERESDDHHRFRAGGKRKQVSRKELRKQERTSQKQKKAEFFAQAKPSAQPPSLPAKRPAEEHSESPARKRARSGPLPSVPEPKATHIVPPEVRKPKVLKPSIKAADAGPSKPTQKAKVVAAPQLPKSQAEEKEDAYMRYLEKQLGYSKGKPKKKKSPEEDDGLDDLLDFAEDLTHSLTKGGATEQVDDGEFSGGSNEFGEGMDSEDEEDEDMPDDGDEDGDEEEWGGVESGSDAEQEGLPQPAEQPTTTPAPGKAYVPPHMRQAAATPSEAMLKLTRQLKGLLNRMTEQNIGSILDSMEDIYRDNSRNDVTSTLTNLIVESVSSHSILLDSYVVLHAAFISSLHKLVGTEFAAYFVQQVVSTYETQHAALPNLSDAGGEETDRGKECSNLIVLLSELYNFQVVSSVLIFGIIRSLLKDDMSEFNVELLLKVLRNSGQQLRADDPLALKDIVQIVQDRVAGKEETMSSRTRFMIETLTNLKNNKTKKLGEQNQGGAAVERMKKFLSGLTKTKHVLAHEPLRISLDDLHSANTKGKWWLVGAAWGGDPLADRQADMEKIVAVQKAARMEESNLLKLARNQGMNSDIRRSIFVVLMSSEDYIDACDRLSQLNLTEVQQREIVRVLLHCCGNEKSYNPYYALVCEHLCKQNHSYKITVQFCLWDFLRDLGETKVGGAAVVKNAREDEGFDIKTISPSRMKNVARCYAWWIARDAVTLGILKPVDFTALKSQTKDFLKELLVHIFVNSQMSTPVITNDLASLTLTRNRTTMEEIFIKSSRIDTVAMGLVYFMTQAFRKLHLEDDKFSKFLVWAVGLAKDTLQTGLDVIPGLEP